MTTSRSRQEYMNSASKPASCAPTPSHSRWLWIRSSSATSTRMAWARGGASTSASFSTHSENAVAWTCEQMPHTRSIM